MDKPFYSEGLHFDCNGCSRCCRFKGGVVLLSQKDLERLALWAGLKPEQFIKVYCRFIEGQDGKNYLCLKNMHNSSEYEDCIFWNKDIPGCDAYDSRPDQCRTYPFWTKVLEDKASWDGEKADCPGINEGRLFSQEEIERELKLYQSRKPITE